MKHLFRRCIGAAIATALIDIAAAIAATTGTDAGWQAYRGGDYAAARLIYEQGAAKGDRLAQFNLAMMLLRGEGGGADIDQAVAWLRKAAEAGQPQAQYSLGLLYESGIGVSRSLTSA